MRPIPQAVLSQPTAKLLSISAPSLTNVQANCPQISPCVHTALAQPRLYPKDQTHQGTSIGISLLMISPPRPNLPIVISISSHLGQSSYVEVQQWFDRPMMHSIDVVDKVMDEEPEGKYIVEFVAETDRVIPHVSENVGS